MFLFTDSDYLSIPPFELQACLSIKFMKKIQFNLWLLASSVTGPVMQILTSMFHATVILDIFLRDLSTSKLLA